MYEQADAFALAAILFITIALIAYMAATDRESRNEVRVQKHEFCEDCAVLFNKKVSELVKE